MDYPTLCYIQSGVSGTPNLRALWTLSTNPRDNRLQQYSLSYTQKQWVHNLAPIVQVKLWNHHMNEGMGTACSALILIIFFHRFHQQHLQFTKHRRSTSNIGPLKWVADSYILNFPIWFHCIHDQPFRNKQMNSFSALSLVSSVPLH